ncbi:Rieske (2Fe-2S) protein [Streptomyces sp. NBC_01142]|uniref:Rieske (2Fe-2S) protein n=1 Tax=Streptomyces sp. NBC_01142 TaxID=2975865 RepID=UPI00225A0029|nr:Rieske (2Fe-2S) protein [Streptomyces sp. NBC_01142]MCX4822099.1 Rieske (2Fe-2S) protein [Streptomyces sp. NBC_01142]
MDTRRRTVLAAGAAGAATLVSGCGDSGGGDGGTASEPPADAASRPAGETLNEGAIPPPQAGKELAETSDIPVGGGRLFADQKVVVTQPQAGDFKAFSAICPHQGCTVRTIADGTIDCPCHESRFRITDGSVVEGPSTRPLPPAQITVSGGTVRLA